MYYLFLVSWNPRGIDHNNTSPLLLEFVANAIIAWKLKTHPKTYLQNKINRIKDCS